MKQRILAATIALSFSMLALPRLVAAPVTGTPSTATAKVKMVKFSVRNDSRSPVTLEGGGQQFVLQPGQSTNVKLPAGTQMTTVNETAHLAAGAIVATVETSLGGNTILVN